MIAAVIATAAGVVHLELLIADRNPIGLWWLWPTASLISASLIAAAYLGVRSRLPPPSEDAGRWIWLFSQAAGDASGQTLRKWLKWTAPGSVDT